jgi:hypothetical protein
MLMVGSLISLPQRLRLNNVPLDMVARCKFGKIATLVSFIGGSAVSTNDPNSKIDAVAMYALQTRVDRSARWFYWVAGLTVVNSVCFILKAQLYFPVGLGIVQGIDGLVMYITNDVFHQYLGIAQAIGLALEVVTAGIFAGFCELSRRRSWWFVVGMSLYALDGLLYLAINDWIGVGMHLFVLYFMYLGFRAARTLNKLKAVPTAPAPQSAKPQSAPVV